MKARRILVFFAGVLLAVPLHAATNLISADEIPPLTPPRGEVAPGFWDIYSSWVIFAAVLLVLLAIVLGWLLTRPKPPPVITPAAVEARQALEALSEQAESGVVLSHVSRIVRHYFSLTFGLPPAERTTTEFCAALTALPHLSSGLSEDVTEFLRQCDQRKFAPSPPQPPFGAVSTAAKLIQLAEQSRSAPALPSQAPAAPRPASP